MSGFTAKNNALSLAQRVARRQVLAWPADARLMSQESFHESWVAALASLLEGAAQKQRAKWGSAQFNSREVLLFAAQHTERGRRQFPEGGGGPSLADPLLSAAVRCLRISGNGHHCVAPIGRRGAFEDGRG